MISKNYAFISQNNTHIQMRIQSLLKTLLKETTEVLKYDCSETNFAHIYEEMITPSLFYDEKIIVLSNADTIFDDKENHTQWIKVIQRDNNDIFLVLQMSEIPRDPQIKKVFELYIDVQDITPLSSVNLQNYIQSDLLKDGFKMDFATQQILIERLKNQEESLYEYLKLLKTYKYQEKYINKDDVVKIVSRPIEDNIFDIVKSYLDGDKVKTIQLFEDLLIKQEDPLSILSMIGRKLNDLEDVKRCLHAGLNQRQISERMHISNGKAYYLIREAKSIQKKDIEYTIDKINVLDYKIKSGRMDKTVGVYLFLTGGIHESSNDRHY
jgi:DNA polymerase-3 subunit delta